MKELLLIAIGSAIVNNVVLSQFLGICPFLGVSKKTETAAGMGGAVVFVITISSFVTALIYKFILANSYLMSKGIDLTYLQTIVFILVIAALVQFVEMFLKKSMPALYQSLGVYLPLITTNCAVLGVALTNVTKEYGILESVVNGFATAFGFLIAIVLMAGLREKIEYNDIPKPFQGTADRSDHSSFDVYRVYGILRNDLGGKNKMNVTAILVAALVVGGVGILIGFFLGISGEKFKVEVDEKEVAILGELPGNNCGGCGYAGCSGLAAAIAKGEAPVNQCPVGGAPVAAKIGAIMGVDAGAGEKKVAFVKCAGTCDKTQKDYEYTGNEDCASMMFVPNGGPKACNYGCLGFGSCVKACPFDAIHIVDGIALVDKEVCKACGKCVAACPKHLIELVPYSAKHIVQCSSKDVGKNVMKACSVGCIGCHLCEKNCPKDAVHVIDNVAYIDQEKCVGCGICAQKCPKKIIL